MLQPGSEPLTTDCSSLVQIAVAFCSVPGENTYDHHRNISTVQNGSVLRWAVDSFIPSDHLLHWFLFVVAETDKTAIVSSWYGVEVSQSDTKNMKKITLTSCLEVNSHKYDILPEIKSTVIPYKFRYFGRLIINNTHIQLADVFRTRLSILWMYWEKVAMSSMSPILVKQFGEASYASSVHPQKKPTHTHTQEIVQKHEVHTQLSTYIHNTPHTRHRFTRMHTHTTHTKLKPDDWLSIQSVQESGKCTPRRFIGALCTILYQ